MKKRLEVSLEEAIEIIKNTRHLPDDERPVFLMMKMHDKTGLLYFCRTVKDPYKYHGSGVYWTEYLKEHGRDVSNIWLRKFDNENDPRLEKMARRISSELDIVESENFANKCIEKGHNKPKTLPSWEYLKECFRYDVNTGELFWKVRPVHHFKNSHRMNIWNTKFSNKVAGSINKHIGYFRISIDDIRYLIHRIIWKLLKNEEPPAIIDHIDGNRTNNRINNLREASKSQNSSNCTQNKNNTTGFKGVSYNIISKQYISRIFHNGKEIWLGSFNTADAASLAYQNKSLELHGEFSIVDQEEYDNNLKNTIISERKKPKGYYYNKDKNKYLARIGYKGKTINLGYFEFADDAGNAYKEAMLKYYNKNI
jgi:hypothetical protein